MTPRRALAGLFRAWKRYISPSLPPACRFEPTCSEYAAEAIERHGVFKGSVMTLGRLLRCHPWSAGGFDPVPSRSAAPPPRG